MNDVLFLCDFPIAILSFTNLLSFLAINLRNYNVVYVIPCIAYGRPERWVAEAKKLVVILILLDFHRIHESLFCLIVDRLWHHFSSDLLPHIMLNSHDADSAKSKNTFAENSQNFLQICQLSLYATGIQLHLSNINSKDYQPGLTKSYIRKYCVLYFQTLA